MRVYEIECNGQTLYFERDAFDNGTLKLAPETSGEQCEDCGKDILESGRVSHSQGAAVKCTCGARYEATESTL